MLICSKNTLKETPWIIIMFLSTWAPCGPAKQTHKVNHHKYYEDQCPYFVEEAGRHGWEKLCPWGHTAVDGRAEFQIKQPLPDLLKLWPYYLSHGRQTKKISLDVIQYIRVRHLRFLNVSTTTLFIAWSSSRKWNLFQVTTKHFALSLLLCFLGQKGVRLPSACQSGSLILSDLSSNTVSSWAKGWRAA